MTEDYNEVEDNGMSPYIKSSKTIKDDGGVDITLHLTPIMYKSLQHICSDVNMLSFELSKTIRYFVCLQKYENKDIDVKLLGC